MPRSQPSSSFKHTAPSVPPRHFTNPYSSVGHTLPTAAPTQTLGQSVKEGFGLGVGSAVAHRVVASIFGAPTVNVVQPTSSARTNQHPCDKERIAFESCMKTQSIDTFCGQEQIAYTDCIRMSNSTSNQ